MIKIKKYILLFIAILSLNYVNAQTTCNTLMYANGQHPTNDTVNICVGDFVTLSSFDSCSVMFFDDFNTATLGTGWSSNCNPQFNNPCDPSPNTPADPYCWIGNTVTQPRRLSTVAYNTGPNNSVSNLCTICFDMDYSTQGQSAPCEGPDLPTVGVHLQYSINLGVTWTDINYWDPNGGYDTVMTTWNTYCENVPVNPTTPIKFSWFQNVPSGNNYDHWGIDNVKITCPTSTGVFWSHGPFIENPPTIYPTISNWYVVSYYDSIAGVFSSDSLYINIVSQQTAEIVVNGQLTNNDTLGVCFGDSLQLSSIGDCSICSGTSILWSTGDTVSYLPVFYATSNQWYSVLYSDSNSFDTDSVFIEINQSYTADFTVNSPIYSNQSSVITYTGNGDSLLNYYWDFDGGIGIPGTGIGPHSVSWNNNGTYYIKLFVNNNGCVTSDIMQIAVDSFPCSATIFANGQHPTNDTLIICVGDSINFTSDGSCPQMNNSFNGGAMGDGWSSTNANPVFSNPCGVGPAGIHLWVGTTPSAIRSLETITYDFSSGGCEVQWWMRYGRVQGSGPCEDPDASNEGVHLQYSTNGGTTWINFPGIDYRPWGTNSIAGPFMNPSVTTIKGSGGYWTPSSNPTAQANSSFYFWHEYQSNVPVAASTANTKLRWAQLANSSAGWDAWGIDEVNVSCPSSTDVIWSHGPTVSNPPTVSLILSDWYIVTYYDSIAGLSFSDSLYINIVSQQTTEIIINGQITNYDTLFTCFNEPLLFSSIGSCSMSNGTSILWSTDNISISLPIIYPLTGQWYSVMYYDTVSSEFDSVYVEIINQQILSMEANGFNLINDTLAINIGDSILFTSSGNCNSASVLWSFGATVSNPINYVYPINSQWYSVLYHDTNSLDKDSIFILMNPIGVEEYYTSESDKFYAPTAITPDGDGVNDIFKIYGTGINKENFELYIYDRKGNLVFFSNKIDKGWNGTIQESKSKGTYTWICKYKDSNNKYNTKSGNLILLK